MNFMVEAFNFLMALLQIKRAFHPCITYVCNLCQSIGINSACRIHFSDKTALIPDFTWTVPRPCPIGYTSVKRYSDKGNIKSVCSFLKRSPEKCGYACVTRTDLRIFKLWITKFS